MISPLERTKVRGNAYVLRIEIIGTPSPSPSPLHLHGQVDTNVQKNGDGSYCLCDAKVPCNGIMNTLWPYHAGLESLRGINMIGPEVSTLLSI